MKEVFCQNKAIGVLQRAYAAGKVPHAYIFAGPDGVGKFKTAAEFAKLLLCRNPVIENTFADNCGSCESCRAFGADSHPDFQFVYKELREFTKDGKDKTTPIELPIDVIREFLIKKVSNRPALSQRKVFIVSEAEKLNAASQNCLLKTLEEPPGYCCIILLCTRPENLLPTTKSRCQTIRFGPIAEEKIIEQLKQTGIDDRKNEYFSRLAQGSLGRACQWAKLELAGANLYEIKRKLIDSVSKFRYADALDLAGECISDGSAVAAVWVKIDTATSKTDINRRAAKTLVQIIISALCDAMKLGITHKGGLINSDQKDKIENLARRFDPEQLALKIADACKTLDWIDSSVNEKLIFEQLLLNLAVSDIMKV